MHETLVVTTDLDAILRSDLIPPEGDVTEMYIVSEITAGKVVRRLREYGYFKWNTASPDGFVDVREYRLEVVLPSEHREVLLFEFSEKGGPVERAKRLVDDVRGIASREGRLVPTAAWQALLDPVLESLRDAGQRFRRMVFSADGALLATAGHGSEDIYLWETRSGRELATLRGTDEYVHSMAFSSDGKRLVTGSGYGAVAVWSVPSGRRIAMASERRGSGGVRSVTLDREGTHVAAGYFDGTVNLWDASTGTRLRTLVQFGDAVYALAFAPDGGTFAAAHRSVTLWETGRWTEIRAIPEAGRLRGSVLSLAFSPDGNRLALDAADWTILLWDVGQRRRIGRLAGHTRDICCLAFSPDGARLASGSWDKTARIWDLEGTAKPLIVRGHAASVASIAFAQDGHSLWSAGRDGTVREWDALTGRPLSTVHLSHSAQSAATTRPNT